MRLPLLTAAALLVFTGAGGAVVQPDAERAAASPQLRWDDTVVPPGFGAVFLPAMALGDREPLVQVFGARGELSAEGTMGRRLMLPPGTYTVRFGSGNEGTQIAIDVRVEAGQTTVVPITWAALEVNVIDRTATPFRGTYELIRMRDREVVGLGVGADPLSGETPRIWVLRPGLYKLVRTGGTYRDRVDFATVRLRPGELTRFVLVQDPDTGEFLGAGEAEPLDVFAEESADQRWRLRGVLGGDVAYRNSDLVGQTEGWSLDLDVFLDVFAAFDDDTHLVLMRLDSEAGFLRPPEGDLFASGRDRTLGDAVYVYQVWPGIGPYLRLGAETSFVPRRLPFESPRAVVELNPEGEVVRDLGVVDEVELAGPFSPTILKQGVGANLQTSDEDYELSVRLGVGSRQTLPGRLVIYEEVGDGPDTLTQQPFVHLEGIEGTVLAYVRVLRFVTLSTFLDGLMPFTEPEGVVLNWRTVLGLRLAGFASLNYRVDLRVMPSTEGTMVLDDHNLLLRFSWQLF